jgi:hypothetical protein
MPYEGKSDKKTFSSKTASSDLLAVAPLVTIAPEDFLGIFPGRISLDRYIHIEVKWLVEATARSNWKRCSSKTSTPGKNSLETFHII